MRDTWGTPTCCARPWTGGREKILPTAGVRPAGVPRDGDVRMAEFENQRMLGSRFHHVDLSGSTIRDANLSGLDVRGSFAQGLRMRGTILVDCHIDGEILGLTVNGVDVSAYVESELDRRDPRRRQVRNPQTLEELSAAFDLMESLWEETVARARTFPPEQLHDRVDDEFSFIETL